jgi:hypothetical protein
MQSITNKINTGKAKAVDRGQEDLSCLGREKKIRKVLLTALAANMVITE